MNSADLLQFFLCVLVFGYVVSGLDDLVFDVIYWTRRLLYGPFAPDIPLSKLMEVPERRAAIFIPAWNEGEVIWETLLYNGEIIDYDRYDIFVGTYPNDPETQHYVGLARQWLKNVHLCVVTRPGPTTKADNLNAMFRTMERREKILDIRYDFIVYHDAEDVFHPLELRLLNYQFEHGSAHMIQTPIFPLPTKPREFTAGTYMDSFTEVQTKDLQVRSAIKGFVPSCGVATGFSRVALDYLKEDGDGKPFDADALTEDYEVGLKLALAGMRACYLRQRVIDDMPERKIKLNPVTPDPTMVSTWSNYPLRFRDAVRQRSRWSLGIVFQSRRLGSAAGDKVDRWLLLHDRKQLWSYPLVALGYILMLAYTSLQVAEDVGAGVNTVFTMPNWLWIGALISSIMMLNRLTQRAIAVGRVYGTQQAFLSILRQPWDNLISMCSLAIAAKQYYRARLRGEGLTWDKTRHVAPTVLRPRLGQVMLKRGWLTPEQLQTALAVQRDDPKPLGDILVGLGYITPDLRDEALQAQKKRAAA